MKNTHTKKKNSFSKILSLLIAVVMLLTLPGLSTLADTDSTTNSAASSASSDTTDTAADTTTAAAKSNTNTALVGSSNTTVSAVADGYYRIYYSQIETVNHSASGFTDANTKWNNINSNGNVYINVGGTDNSSGTVYPMSDTGLTLTKDNQPYKVYYYDIPVNTKSLFFLCENKTEIASIKTRTNDVTLSWNGGQISGYKTKNSEHESDEISVNPTSNNCFYASNPYVSEKNGSDWFYQVNSTDFNPVSKIELANTAVATGDKATISAEITPSWIRASDLTWTTDNSDVAEVEPGGVVTGKQDGTATIKAQYGDVTASCTVTVSTTPSISIAPDPASVSVNGTMTFTATIKPDQYNGSTITWSVRDTSIASLTGSNGEVKGLKKGTTEVTASFTVDDKTYSTSAPLTVTNPSETVSGITLTPTAATIQIGKTQQLTATVTPTGTSAVSWSSNNEAVATVDQNGLVTGLKAGTATITATATEDSNITATAIISVTKSTTLYYLAPVSWSGVWVYFYKDNANRYNTSPDAAMTKLDASDYLVDGAAIDASNLYSITVPDTNADNAIFASESGKWTNQDPTQSEGGGRSTAPDGKNGYYNGNGNAVLVTRKAPTSIAVTPATNTIASNQTVQLTATATYNDASTEDISGTVTWTSSDTSIATVSSSGLVTAVQEGSVTITATVPGSTVSGTAAITVKDAKPTELSLTPSSVSLLAGTTATLTPSFKPENVNASGVKLKWTSSDEKVATVDADGVVTAVSDGKATITATVDGTNVQATATVTVSKDDSRIYYYAALSKLSYEKTPAGKVDRPRSIPVADDTVYAYAWNNSDTTGGKLITMKKLVETSGNGITYADGDIYYTDEAAGYQYIAFANGKEIQKNGALNLYGYGEGTAALTIPKDVTNPCFYAGSGDDSVYSSAQGKRPGYWASLFTVFDPEKVSGSDPVYVAKETDTKPTTDSHKSNAAITYVSSTLYDYYSDYELNGKEVSTDTNSDAQVSQRNWVTFREFDQALSDYYTATGKTAWDQLVPIYTGHFQPDYLKGTLFSSIANTLNLYGWSSSGTSYNKFMATENSGMDVNGGEGMYAKASQGLVGSSLKGYQDGSLGTGTLLTNDSSAALPHFNKSFLEGKNSKNAVLGSVYENVAFPFTQEADPYYKDVNYYTFDSARESVYYRTDANGEGYLEDVGTDSKSMNVNSNSGTSDISTTYGYFPFNEDSASKNAKTYDYGFGTKLEFQFKLNNNGDVDSAYGTNGKAAPTIFKFSGDDDVWVFIDGKLVLDLGGSHGQVQGAINFSSDLSGTAQYPSTVKGATVSATVPANSIWVSDTKATAGTSTPYDLSSLNLQDGKKHTLTLYYMERGMWESNMMIQFNMSIEKTLTVKKDWKNYDGSDLADSKKTTVYAAVKRSLPDGTAEFVNLTGSTATDGSRYLIPLTSANQWTQTFSVDEYKNGAEKKDENKYTYYLYEVQVDSSGNPVYSNGVPALYSDGQKMTLNGTTYQVSGTGAVTGTTGTITNTRQQGSGVTITKAWSGTTSEEMKPKNVYVVLYEKNTDAQVKANEIGKPIGNDNGVITLNSGNNWTASVDDLKASSSYIFKEVKDENGSGSADSDGKIQLTGANGNTYTYTVSGGDVTNGSATITNTYAAQKTKVSITKEWKDENDFEIKSDDTSLPDVIYVKLKRTGSVNNKEVTQYWRKDGTFTTDKSNAGSVELKKSENWTKIIEGLDVYADIVKQTPWTYSLCGEMAGSESESGHLIRINAAQYVVNYGSSYSTEDKTGSLTVTNTKLPQTAVTVQKIWKNMDGKTSDEITKEHSETIRVYLKRFTKDSSGKEENVGYYKLSDKVVSFVDSQKDATAISLTKENNYKETVSGLDQYLVTVDDDGSYTPTPYNFVLVSESGSWSTTSTSSTTSSADTSGSVNESGGKITLNGKTYIVTYGGSAVSTDTSPTVTVTNKYSPVFTLPGTGGRGRNILLGILGGAAVLAAVLYWNIRKTRRRKFGKE